MNIIAANITAPKGTLNAYQLETFIPLNVS